ncbi:hypothetical protein HG530_011555 [Fusarium avenaceum]|nr:hypothetical protein HG530_011555 [Fusarium avenaceum]
MSYSDILVVRQAIVENGSVHVVSTVALDLRIDFGQLDDVQIFFFVGSPVVLPEMTRTCKCSKYKTNPVTRHDVGTHKCHIAIVKDRESLFRVRWASFLEDRLAFACPSRLADPEIRRIEDKTISRNNGSWDQNNHISRDQVTVSNSLLSPGSLLSVFFGRRSTNSDLGDD